MNTFVLLVMTTCTPAADPLPVIDSRYSTVPSYGSYGTPGLSDSGQEGRPRFFGRLRNLFTRRFQGDDLYTRGNATYPNETPARNGYTAGSMMGNNYSPNSATFNNGSTGSTAIAPGYTVGTPIYSGSVPPSATAPNSLNPTYLRPQPASPMPSAPAANPGPEPF